MYVLRCYEHYASVRVDQSEGVIFCVSPFSVRNKSHLPLGVCPKFSTVMSHLRVKKYRIINIIGTFYIGTYIIYSINYIVFGFR